MFTREDISKARSSRNVCVIKNAVNTDVKWKNILDIYNRAEEKDLNYASFSSLIINNTEQYTSLYDSIIESISKVHGGKLVEVNSIIHFFSRNTDELNDADCIVAKDKFISLNPHKIPAVPLTYEEHAPTIHIDRADGFFIQNEGSTLWTIYRDEDVKEYRLNPGDMIYIPKFIIHSVDSLTARHSASIVFKDVQHFVCKHCGSLNS